MNFCFVILHYLTDQDTIKCIESIEKLEGINNALVIVVDNFSNNGSIEKVEEYSRKYPNCKILKNKENVGYARGNNVGYNFIKKSVENPFIIILNNDIFITQSDFLKKILKRYESDAYAVLGPDIISLVDGGHQNPLMTIPNKNDISKQIFRYRLLLILSKIGIYDFLKQNIGRDKENNTNNKYQTFFEIKNMALHGSCIVFSPIYVNDMEEAFCPDTFLFKEEYILAKRCESRNLKMVYDPEIKVFHKEDSSINSLRTTEKGKREFLYYHLIKSDKVLLRYLR